MVCKEDVITWFKDAASYRRIDVMCALINMCVPFELRYLGTCIEEQGKHDYQELRGAALTANNTEKLAKELANVKGVMDKTIRHRVTIYISLLQSHNYSSANWLFSALLRTESLDCYLRTNCKDVDVQTELFLLYTMALNHPAFTFEQKCHFGAVLSRLNEIDAVAQVYNQPPPCPPGLGYTVKPPLPVSVHHIPIGVSKGPNTLPHEARMPPPGLPIPAVHGEFIGPPPQPMWPRTHFTCPPPELGTYPPPISPLVSQHSSPSPSRSVSPSRMFGVPCRAPMPPHLVHIDQLPLPPLKDTLVLPPPGGQTYNTDHKSVPIDEVIPIDKTQHQWLESVVIGGKIPNGLIAGPNKHVHPLSTDLQQLSLDGDATPAHCPSSSTSSNSSECHTPPGTPTEIPTPHGPGRGAIPDTLKRNPPGLAPPPVDAPNPVPYTYPLPANFHNRSIFYSPYRPHPFTFQQNGEIPYLLPQYMPMMYSSTNATSPSPAPAVVQLPKISCYNCGHSNHTGPECKEQNIEEITQKKGYQLEYPQVELAPPSATSDK